MTCIWCTGKLSSKPEIRTQDRLKTVTGPLFFYRCKECKSDVLMPLPDQDAEAPYEKAYMYEKGHNSSWLGRLYEFIEWNLFYRLIYLKDARLILRHTKAVKPRLLDAGCGTGLRVKVFNTLGFEAEGIEISSRSVDYATHRANIKVRAMRLSDLIKNHEKFDVITAYAVLEHLNQPDLFFNEAKEILTNDGIFVLRFPTNSSLQLRLFGGNHIQYREAPRHVWLPSISGVIKTASTMGFELVDQRADLIVCAGDVGITLVPQSTFALAVNKGKLGYIFWRGLGTIATLFPGIPLAWIDGLDSIGSHTDLVFRKIS